MLFIASINISSILQKTRNERNDERSIQLLQPKIDEFVLLPCFESKSASALCFPGELADEPAIYVAAQ
jgi:hypothetical protein